MQPLVCQTLFCATVLLLFLTEVRCFVSTGCYFVIRQKREFPESCWFGVTCGNPAQLRSMLFQFTPHYGAGGSNQQ